MNPRHISPLLFVALLSLAGCAGGTGHQLPTITHADITSTQTELISARQPLVTYQRSDGEYQSVLARVHQRLLYNARPLCDHTGYRQCRFETIYDPEDEVNAYASEDGQVTIFRGLLDHLETEDEIAAVVAHEMGHHLANHNEEHGQNAAVGGILTGVVAAVALGAANVDNPNYTAEQQQQDIEMIGDMAAAGASLGALSYSKEAEREADLLGAYLLARAGYDLRRAERLYVTLTRLPGESPKDTTNFFDTHPAGVERLAAWRKIMDEVNRNPTKLPYVAVTK